MKTHSLLILRHAKSDRDGDDSDDFARPLARRGRVDARRMAHWLEARGLTPDLVLSSPACRARETTEAVVEILRIPPGHVHYDDRLYLAACDTLIAVLRGTPTRAGMMLLVGHNPGLEDLLERLCPVAPPRNDDGKLLTAGALAQLMLRQPWSRLAPHGAELVELVRPRELKNRPED